MLRQRVRVRVGEGRVSVHEMHTHLAQRRAAGCLHNLREDRANRHVFPWLLLGAHLPVNDFGYTRLSLVEAAHALVTGWRRRP
jgi:hypothetical protein